MLFYFIEQSVALITKADAIILVLWVFTMEKIYILCGLHICYYCFTVTVFSVFRDGLGIPSCVGMG